MKQWHILCLSHLVWEAKLFQRPQQLMSQFDAMGATVLYMTLMSSKRWLKSAPEEREVRFGTQGRALNLPFLPASGKVKLLSRLSQRSLLTRARNFLRAAPGGTRLLWLQHPGFMEVLDRLPHDVLVYDCMDPFESFQRTASDVPGLERQLLKRADVVFTGGRSLHRQREGTSANIHCFPSGIDYPHFAKGAEPGTLPDDLKPIRKPVLGYFGAVDERIDWKLMEAVCRARPEWSLVFLGPLINMARCPFDAPNFHYLGGKNYASLPDYLRGFDVCLIPWLVNDLTKYMSPTKTPEYLAAGRPVVSVPIPDVVADYGNEVFVADNPEGFIAACDKAIARGIGPSLKPAIARTWRETAVEMLRLVETARG